MRSSLLLRGLAYRRPIVAFGLALTLLTPHFAWAEILPEQRVKIFLTALGFNRTLAAAPYGVVMGIFGECPVGEALFQAEKKQVGGKAISVVKATKLTYAYFDSAAINVLYLCHANESEADLLAKVAPRLAITVIADNPAFVDSFALMGVREIEGSPRLRLNMKVARESQIEFDPRILGAAEIAAN